MDSKFLQFEEEPNEGKKTKKFSVYNKQEVLLGKISFRPGWKKYVFTPNKDTVWDDECLNDISTMLKKLTDEWKGNHPKTEEPKKKEYYQYQEAWWMPKK